MKVIIFLKCVGRFLGLVNYWMFHVMYPTNGVLPCNLYQYIILNLEALRGSTTSRRPLSSGDPLISFYWKSSFRELTTKSTTNNAIMSSIYAVSFYKSYAIYW